MACDKIFINAQLATMENNSYGIIEKGAMAIQADKIVWVGDEKNLPGKLKQTAKELIDVEGRWITPGLVDCHTHIVYGGSRANEFEQRLKGVSYADIQKAGGGIYSTVNATRNASEQQLYDLALPRVNHLLNEGVTTLEIKSGYGLDLETESKMLKVARRIGKTNLVTVKTTFLGAHTVAKEFDGPDDYIDFVIKTVLPEINQQNLADAVDIFCETIAFSPEHVEQLFSAAENYRLPLKIHAEQLSDSQGAITAAKFKALSADHLEYLTPDGVKAMAESNMVAVLLPGAFYYLKETKKPPLAQLREHKVSIAIATDANPGSSPTTSLLLMINMACTLFEMTPEEALLGVTQNAAKALGMEQTIGSLKVGKQADFVLWNIQAPAELAYNFGFNPCYEIYQQGKRRKCAQ